MMIMEEVDLSDSPLRPELENQASVGISDSDAPDPRIQVELERLNTSTDLINKLEVDLDEGRMIFRQMLAESTQRINILAKRLGKCIDQARPYYDARIKSKQSLMEAQKSAVRYERAVSQHTVAREMVQLAEEGLLTRGCIFDSTWQEMLNHGTTKVNDAETEKVESAIEHKAKSQRYHEAEQRAKYLQKELKRAIAKSRPYFELKASVNQRLEEQKHQVKELEGAVSSAKGNYSQALCNLETISDQIHKSRRDGPDLGIRGVGVGAESPPRPPFCKERIDLDITKGIQEMHLTSTERQTHPLNLIDSQRTRTQGPQDPADFSGWQVIGYPAATPKDLSLLSVDDKESVVSDSESLTSMEMLSEEAISHLMLEEEIHEASFAMGSPPYNSPIKEFLDPPSLPVAEIAPEENTKCKLVAAESEDELYSSITLPDSSNLVASKDEHRKNKKLPLDDSSSDSGGAWEFLGQCHPRSDTTNTPAAPAAAATSPHCRPRSLHVDKFTTQGSSSSPSIPSSQSEHSSATASPSYAPLCGTPETPFNYSQCCQNDDPTLQDI